MDWRHQAACRTHDPELFFPIGDAGPALLQIEEAKAVCRGCPVVARCLEWGRAVGVEFGIWGGLSESEHRSLRRRWATVVARRKTCQGEESHGQQA
ncbi:WhiB family transcriptional regulator [Streptomyces sp. S.PB5]|uniref:WhiB family transcriptional regulator n=1 Tax=Streptomyces sp. S.PB5 TaxID=3020844 RepID=UPI0025B1E4E1|nr:WhiB family transcriptional regulator [Streptomyces sp. S.PB5]MDN3027039.1 WhiB family transcriptional regulator [Streptomyces sp. S.PB5]